MSPASPPSLPGRLLRLLTEILFFVAVWWAADRLVHALGWPLPGGVIGLLVVTALLLTGVIAPRRVEAGARWLLGEMLLFFVPPLMALIRHPELLSTMGLKLALAIVVGTLFVMGGVGLVVAWVIRMEDRMGAHRVDQEVSR